MNEGHVDPYLSLFPVLFLHSLYKAKNVSFTCHLRAKERGSVLIIQIVWLVVSG